MDTHIFQNKNKPLKTEVSLNDLPEPMETLFC